ncbi:hypothetical protein ACEXOS_008740 [Herbiconiux sp. P16]|uniref:hypothetical protein n=1 Tax=Herbiconiux wuyangfengii TaxID=3342794 RepID=UPI0035B6CA04
MDRIAGLPVSALDISRRFDDRVLGEYECSLRERAFAAAAVSDAVHSSIPLASKAERVELLRIRRSLHNARSISPGDISCLENHVEVRLVGKLRETIAKEDMARRKLDQCIVKDEIDGIEMLTEILRDPDFDRALSLVAPAFAESLNKLPLTPGSSLAQTLLFYVIRAALKPSPLSQFARLNVEDVALQTTVVSLSSSIIHNLIRAATKHPDYAPSIELVKPPVWNDGETTFAELKDFTRVDTERPWVRNRIVQVIPSAPDLSSILRWDGVGRESLLQAIGGSDPELRARRLAETGLLEAKHTSFSKALGLSDLIARWRPISEVNQDGVIERLELIARIELQLGPADGVRRRQLLKELRQAVSGLFEFFAAPYPRVRLVNEDAGSTGTVPFAPRELMALDAIASEVRPSIFRTHVYDVLKDRFVTTYGSGAIGVNALDFFRQCATSQRLTDEVGAAQNADRLWSRIGDPDRAFLPVGSTSAPPALSVMYQVLPEGHEGDLVINQFASGSGSLFARHHHLDSTGSMAQQVRTWLNRLYPNVGDGNQWAFIPSVDSSSLQATASGILPTMRWDDVDRSSPSFADLTIRHDPDLDVLEFCDRAGIPAAPIHFGIVPAWLSDGAVGLAMSLMDPWRDGSVLTRDSHPRNRLKRAMESATHSPRRVSGRVVQNRATWYFAAEDVPQMASTNSATEFLITLNQWRRDQGIPGEVFAWAIGESEYRIKLRKPLWMDFHSQISIRATLPLATSLDYVKFQEVLPTRSMAESMDDHRVRERMVFMRWERAT